MINIITNCLEIVPAKLRDYKKLAEYHYETGCICPTTNIYTIRGRGHHAKAFPDPIAVIVYRMPIPFLTARNTATDDYFKTPPTLSSKLKLINKHIRYIARLIVDPRFRKIGLATWLLKETLTTQTVPIIETLTPIDFTNKIFQKAGFQLYHSPATVRYTRLKKAILALGLTEDSFKNPTVVQERIDNLPKAKIYILNREFQIFINSYRRRSNMSPGLERTKFILSKMTFPQAYLIWYNPKTPNWRKTTRRPHDTAEPN